MMKKIIAIATVLTVSVWLVGPGVAQGATIEELQAQIAALTASLAALQAQLAALGGGTGAVPAACTGITSFTVNLTVGSTGADVKCLQALLNTSADTQVAASGVGSLGNETLYFGSLTKAAVAKYQVKNSITPPAGYFGPKTRAKIDPMLVVGGGGGGGAVCGNGTCDTGETTTSCPADCKATGGSEGGILGTINSVPASGAEVFVSATVVDVAVAAIDVKAIGDVVVNRLDLNFDTRPWLYVSSVTVTDGTTSKSLAVTAENTSEVTVGSSYLFRVDDLNISIPVNTTKTLTVKVDAVSGMPPGESTKDIVLTFAANAVRATDGAAIQQYAPTAALSTRTFTVKEGDTANIEVTAAVDNPKARTVIVQSTAETTGVVLAKINVKATNRDAILRTIRLTDAVASGTGGTLKTIYLYDGDKQLSSTSSVAATASTTQFTDIGLTIPKDTTKTLTLKATVPKAQGNYVTNATSTNASSTITFEASADGFAAEDATSFAAATVSGSAPNPGGVYFYQKAPMLSLASASITSISIATGTIAYNGKAGARIKVNVTAEGGDIYVSSSTDYVYDTLATSTIGASTTVVQSLTSNATVSGAGNFLVYSGETKWFESYAELTRADDGNSSTVGDLATYVYLTMLSWQDADSAHQGSNITQDWALTDMKTGSVVLEYFR